METNKLKKMADAYISQIKKEQPENLDYCKQLANRALNGDGEASKDIALYYGSCHTEGKREWLEIAAYDQGNAEAYYYLAESYFYESFALAKEYDKIFQLIDIANKRGCRIWDDAITFVLSLHDMTKAISYYEHGYYHGYSIDKGVAAQNLCHIYCGLLDPAFRNKEKYYYWLNELHKYDSAASDNFNKIYKGLNCEISFRMDYHDKELVSHLFKKSNKEPICLSKRYAK